jgi:hypothetical protein
LSKEFKIMDLRKEIKDKYGSVYNFCKKKNLTNQRVSYWCNQDWEYLNKRLRDKILDLL